MVQVEFVRKNINDYYLVLKVIWSHVTDHRKVWKKVDSQFYNYIEQWKLIFQNFTTALLSAYI